MDVMEIIPHRHYQRLVLPGHLQLDSEYYHRSTVLRTFVKKYLTQDL